MRASAAARTRLQPVTRPERFGIVTGTAGRRRTAARTGTPAARSRIRRSRVGVAGAERSRRVQLSLSVADLRRKEILRRIARTREIDEARRVGTKQALVAGENGVAFAGTDIQARADSAGGRRGKARHRHVHGGRIGTDDAARPIVPAGPCPDLRDPRGKKRTSQNKYTHVITDNVLYFI